MFSSKAAWYLPCAILAAVFFLYASIGLSFNQWITGTSGTRPPHALDAILSPETMDVLCEDARLHDTLFRLTETVAKASLDYGSAYRLGGLRSIGEDLTKKLQHIRASNVPTRKTKRWGLRNGLRSRDDTEGQLLDRILDGAGSGNGSLGDLFGQALSGLGGDLAGALATPAYFLGIGLG
jgi:hypothetical protein